MCIVKVYVHVWLIDLNFNRIGTKDPHIKTTCCVQNLWRSLEGQGHSEYIKFLHILDMDIMKVHVRVWLITLSSMIGS